MKLENLLNYRTLVGVNYTQRANDQLIFNLTKEDFPHFSEHTFFVFLSISHSRPMLMSYN